MHTGRDPSCNRDRCAAAAWPARRPTRRSRPYRTNRGWKRPLVLAGRRTTETIAVVGDSTRDIERAWVAKSACRKRAPAVRVPKRRGRPTFITSRRAPPTDTLRRVTPTRRSARPVRVPGANTRPSSTPRPTNTRGARRRSTDKTPGADEHAATDPYTASTKHAVPPTNTPRPTNTPVATTKRITPVPTKRRWHRRRIRPGPNQHPVPPTEGQQTFRRRPNHRADRGANRTPTKSAAATRERVPPQPPRARATPATMGGRDNT